MKKIIIAIFLLSCVVTAQNKNEKISFKNDIMPILKKKCMNCHNTEDESPSGLNFDNYKELMRGDSRNGPVVIPKKGSESILIMKLNGTAKFGRQMPRGRKPLEDDMIEKFSKWIDQGAKNN